MTNILCLKAHQLRAGDAIVFPGANADHDHGLVAVRGVEVRETGPEGTPVTLVTENWDGVQFIDHVDADRLFATARAY